MSKSLRRVEAALASLGLNAPVKECAEETRTAEQAAAQAGCTLDQIVKSIIFGETGGEGLFLFLTAGGNRVDPAKAAALAGKTLVRADPDIVRARTGFAIGGVSPVGLLSPVPAWMDERLVSFDVVWAAAGTPRHIFPVDPRALVQATGATVAAFCV